MRKLIFVALLLFLFISRVNGQEDCFGYGFDTQEKLATVSIAKGSTAYLAEKEAIVCAKYAIYVKYLNQTYSDAGKILPLVSQWLDDEQHIDKKVQNITTLHIMCEMAARSDDIAQAIGLPTNYTIECSKVVPKGDGYEAICAISINLSDSSVADLNKTKNFFSQFSK